VVSTPLKNISQMGLLFPIYGKIKNVPNHQPASVARFDAGASWRLLRSEAQLLHNDLMDFSAEALAALNAAPQ
jgi:hypothetical protein